MLQGEALKLTRKQFDMLFFLASNAGRVLSREQLYEHVWPTESVYDVGAAVKNRIADLRSSVGKDYIETVRGVGYRFNPKPKDAPASEAGGDEEKKAEKGED